MTAAETIAVVDDTEGTRLALRRTLERAGYDVVEGACGADALRIARDRAPSLMVLDVHLPDLMGPDVVKQLKGDPVTRNIPILHLSASFTEDSDRAFGLDSGADAYLTEPVEPELLLATIHALLRSRAAERVAERALQTRDEFLSITSHDIRGLLQALRLTLDVQLLRAQDRNFEREVMVRAIRRSVSDVQQMTRLAEDLLDRSQLEAGKLLLRLEDNVDLVALVRGMVHAAEEEAKAFGSSIVVDAPEPVVGKLDPVRVRQVIGNLLSNAIKYGAGKPVRVSVRAADGAARISISDGGPGIAASEQEHVFERFERGAASERAGSYGLGLWIVRELVHLHGGSATVQSAPGQGATFTVTLPLSNERRGA